MGIVLPVYMYHQVAPQTHAAYEPYLYVTPETLQEQIRQLRGWGLEILTLSDACARIRSQVSTPRAAVLTFDDLGECFRCHALPVLQAEAAPATGFAVAAPLTGQAPVDLPGGFQPLAADALQDLAGAGIEIGSHTVTHRELTNLPDEDATRELIESRRMLEDCLGQTCRALCYPRGRFSPRIQEAVRQAGYESACTTLRGSVHGPAQILALSRVRAHGGRTGLKLRYTTTRLFDWFHARRRRAAAARLAASDALGESA